MLRKIRLEKGTGKVVALFSATILLIGCAGNRPVAEEESASPNRTVLADEPAEDAIDSETVSAPDDTAAGGETSGEQYEESGQSEEQVAQSEVTDDAAQKEALLDRAQRTVFGITNSTTRWFDGFFGESQLNDAEHVSRGRLTTGFYWDQRDEFSTRVRFRARYALPGLQNRTRLILGRGDVDDLIDGTEEPIMEGLPGSFDTEQDDDWLFGLGFSRSGNSRRGFDLGVGVKVATPLEPYIRLTYRYNQLFNNKWLLGLRPRVFAQSQRGTGVTMQTNLSRIFGENFVIRWANDFSAEERVEGLGWRSDLLAYQGLSNNRALSYGIFAQGESGAEVPVQNYGFEIRYRQRLYREWFFIQFSTGYSWPRFELEEIRESNFGVGILFEMRFGKW